MPKILIADHDKIIRKEYSDMLKHAGHQVLEASDGISAQRVINKHQPDLALLAVDLPRRDGITLCREFSHSSKTKIILITKSDKGIDQIIGLESGAEDYIKKSVILGEIRARVELVLRRSKSTSNSVPEGILVTPLFWERHVPINPKLCFVIMPFSESLRPTYDIIKKVVQDQCGLRCLRVDELSVPQPIIEDIWKLILQANIVIADLTELNPNVFYELGVAHTVGHNVILLTQKVSDVPFDVRHRRLISYTNDLQGAKKLEEELHKAILSVQSHRQKPIRRKLRQRSR